MNNTLTIELIHENSLGNNYFYTTLKLPAKEYEIRDAYQRARIFGRDDSFNEISVIECQLLPELLFKRLDSPTIDELNFFAKRLSLLNEDERLVFSVVCPKIISKMDEPVSMKDLINCTYGLELVSMLSAVSDEKELGAFVIENELNDDVAAIPETSMYLLDRESIGRLQRISDGGVFVKDKYIVAGDYELKEIYDGKQLPKTPTEKWYAFKLMVGAPLTDDDMKEEHHTKWLTIPVSRKEADKIAKELGMRKIEDCVYFDFESSIPQIDDKQFGNMKDFDKLNHLAEIMPFMSPEEQIKFKAILEAEAPRDLAEVLDIADNLNDYQISVYTDDAASFYKEYLSYHLDERFDKRWLDSLLCQNEGKTLLERLNAKVTEYGVVSERFKNLFDFVPYSEEAVVEEDTENEDLSITMGGM